MNKKTNLYFTILSVNRRRILNPSDEDLWINQTAFENNGLYSEFQLGKQLRNVFFKNVQIKIFVNENWQKSNSTFSSHYCDNCALCVGWPNELIDFIFGLLLYLYHENRFCKLKNFFFNLMFQKLSFFL